MAGLDLNRYYKDIAQIVTAKFGTRVNDVDDLVQEVCLKILNLNQGSSPYDPSRCQPSTYIHMVARGVWIKQMRGQKVETSPLEALEVLEDKRNARADLESPTRVTTQVLRVPQKVFVDWNEELLKSFEQYLRDCTAFENVLPRRVFRLLRMGYTRTEIANLTHVSMYQVKKQKARLADLANNFLTSSRSQSL